MGPEARGLLIGALATSLMLVGGMALGVALGNTLFEGLPGHMLTRAGAGAFPALGGVLLAGAAWGGTMGMMFDRQRARSYARAGMLGFSMPLIAAALVLLSLEGAVLGLGARLGLREFPVQRLFTVLFVPTAFILTALGTLAIARQVVAKRTARGLARQAGLMAAAAFLLTNLVMERRGWVVGAPGAAERNTMITVLLVGMIAAALAGGAVLGRQLAAWQAQRQEKRTAGKEALQAQRRPDTVEEEMT